MCEKKKPKALGQTLHCYMQAMAHEVCNSWQFPQQRISLVFAEHWTELRALLLILHKDRERLREGMNIYSVLNKWDKWGCK